MTQQENNLIELLKAIKFLERRCQTIDANEAVPIVVYELFDQLRNEIARWGTECIVEETKDK